MNILHVTDQAKIAPSLFSMEKKMFSQTFMQLPKILWSREK